MKKNNKGFSLVELIVVIAIMAILASVAVAGFSLYIPKAQKANDKQLVSDVQYALDLYCQANPNMTGVEMIVISTTGTTVSGGANSHLDKALRDAFGDYGSMKLQYENWGNGAAVTNDVLNHFQTGQNGALADVYNGNSVPTFAEDVDELFVLIRDTSLLVADKSQGFDFVNIESGASLLKYAADYTLDVDGTAGANSAFGDVEKFQTAWGDFRPVAEMAGEGNVLGNANGNGFQFDESNFAPAIATAAVIKARNVSIATYLQNQNPAYAKYYDAIANLGGTIPTDLAEVVYNNIDAGGNPKYDMIAEDLGLSNDPDFNLVEFEAACGMVQNEYFVTDASGTSPAERDAKAYYAMMDTVGATNEGTSNSDDEYWNELAGAVNIYGQIASGKLSLNEVLGAYSTDIPENCIAILVVANGNGYEITVNPSYVME